MTELAAEQVGTNFLPAGQEFFAGQGGACWSARLIRRANDRDALNYSTKTLTAGSPFRARKTLIQGAHFPKYPMGFGVFLTRFQCARNL